MHEQADDDTPPRQRLIPLLTLDFTPAEKIALARQSKEEGNALARLLANARSTEDIDARLASEENIELGQTVERLLEPAPVTTSFKRFIAGEVRRAHAWQGHVDEVVAPDRLGLMSGDGIFDPAQSKDIEAQTLRGRAFDVMREYTVAMPTEDDPSLPPLVLRPGKRPRDYVAAVDELNAWDTDYQQTYGEGGFEGIEAEAYLDAAPRATLLEGDEGEREGFANLVRRLTELRDSGEQS